MQELSDNSNNNNNNNNNNEELTELFLIQTTHQLSLLYHNNQSILDPRCTVFYFHQDCDSIGGDDDHESVLLCL